MIPQAFRHATRKTIRARILMIEPLKNAQGQIEKVKIVAVTLPQQRGITFMMTFDNFESSVFNLDPGELFNIFSGQTVDWMSSPEKIFDFEVSDTDDPEILAYQFFKSGTGRQPTIIKEVTAERGFEVPVGATVDPDLSSGVFSRSPQAASWPKPRLEPPFTPIEAATKFDVSRDFIRIGYATLTAPVHMIEHTAQSRIVTRPIMRMSGTIKHGLGAAYENYTMTWVATGPQQIQESVVEILEQTSLTPFLTVQGGPFGDHDEETADIPYNEIAVRSVSVSTIPGQPNSLRVALNFDPFMWWYYVPPHEHQEYPLYYMDNMICWPLFKVWCKERKKSKFEKPLMTGEMVFSFPQNSFLSEFDEIVEGNLRYTDADELSMLKTVRAILEGRVSSISSRYAKELKVKGQNPATRYIIIKTGSRLVWQYYLSGRGKEFFEGLVDWSPISGYNFVDDEGNFLPESAALGFDYFIPEKSEDEEVNTGGSGPIKILTHTKSDRLPTAAGSPWLTYGILLRVPNEKATEFKSGLTTLYNHHKITLDLAKRDIREAIRAAWLSDPESIYTFSGRPDIVIENVSATKSNNLSVTSMRGYPLPLHQYLGGLDTIVAIEGVCFGPEAKQYIQNLKDEFDRRSVERRISEHKVDEVEDLVERVTGKEIEGLADMASKQRVFSAFLKVDNEIFQIMGVDFVVPVAIQFSSVDGQPEVWKFNMTFLEMDPKMKKAEDVRFLPTALQTVSKVLRFGLADEGTRTIPTVDKAREYFSLQAALAREELYPDMELPTQSEFTFWVNAIAKRAKELNGESVVLSSAEKRISDIVYDEIVQNTKEIAEKWKFYPGFDQEEGGANVEPSSYMDPDFYCYYPAGVGWDSDFDMLAEDLMGPPTDKLSAEGRPEEGATPQAGQLWQDSDATPVKLAYSNQMWAANAQAMLSFKTDLRTNGIVGPEGVDKFIKEMERGEKDMRETPRYWKSLDPEEDAPVLDSLEDPEQNYIDITYVPDGEFADESQILPQFSRIVYDKEGHPTNLDVDDLGGGLLHFHPDYVNELRKMFFYQWRQWALKYAAEKGRAFARDGKYGAVPYIQGRGYAGFMFAIRDEVGRILGAVVPRELLLISDVLRDPRYNTLEKILDAVVFEALTNSDFNVQRDTPVFPIFEGIARALTSVLTLSGDIARAIISGTTSARDGTIARTAVANLNYELAALDRISPPSWNLNGDVHSRIEQTQGWIDFHSAKKYIDPNIVRAFFLARTDMGTLEASTSLQSAGIGDIVLDVPEFSAGNPQKQILGFINRFSQNMKMWSDVPTLALAWTHLQLTEDGLNMRAELGDPQSAIHQEFSKVASRVAKDRYSKASQDAICELINKVGLGQIMDFYYSRYIELCRVLGGYIAANKRDAFFNPFNPLVAISLHSDREIMNAFFSPSCNPVNIRLSRREISPGLAVEERFEIRPGELSLEDRAKRAKKLKAGLAPFSEDSIYGMLYDMRKYSPFGRLAAAFPSFSVTLISPGGYIAEGNRRLWDHYYTRGAITSIEVFQSRHTPVYTCDITYSNIFKNLTAYTQQEAILQELWKQVNQELGDKVLKTFTSLPGALSTIKELWSFFLSKEHPAIIQAYKNNHLRQIALSPGTRIHVRMGYGAHAGRLPIVFNGTIAAVPVEHGSVTLQAVGDGAELEKTNTKKLIRSGDSFAYNANGILGVGLDPTTIIIEAMIAQSLPATIAQGQFFRDFSSGVWNFGEVYFTSSTGYSAAEVLINIYSPRKGTLEQGIEGIDNFFRSSALYNWDDKDNLFSVQVKEPTIWKIIEVCRKACLDFVAAPMPFTTYSTLFFGKWWWPYHFTYDPAILKFTPVESPTGIPTGRNLSTFLFLQALVGRSPSEVPVTYRNQNLGNVTMDNLGQWFRWVGGGKQTTNLREMWMAEGGIVKKIAMLIEENRINKETGEANYDLSQAFVLTSWSHDRLNWSIRIASPNNPGRKDKVLVIKVEKSGDEWKVSLVQMVNLDDVGPLESYSLKGQDLLLDVNNLVEYLRWKPFMQCYVAHSMINLLDSSIRADKTGVFTDAIGVHMYNGWASSDGVSKIHAYSVDSDIIPSERKTMLVDTGILLTTAQSFNLFKKGLERIPVAGQRFNETPDTPAIENAVVSALADSVKEMYQGWFTIRGQATIKPRDLVRFEDHKTEMKGPVWVKEVIHRMDNELGFITMVSPDAVVFPHSALVGSHLMSSLLLGILPKLTAYYVFKMAAVAIKSAITGKYSRAHAFTVNAAVHDFTLLLNSRIGETGLLSNVPAFQNLSLNDLNKEFFTNYRQTLLNEILEAADKSGVKVAVSSSDDISSIIRAAERLGVDPFDVLEKQIGQLITDRGLIPDSTDAKILRFILELEAEGASLEAVAREDPRTAGLSAKQKREALKRIRNERIAKFMNGNADELRPILGRVLGLADPEIELYFEIRKLEQKLRGAKGAARARVQAQITEAMKSSRLSDASLQRVMMVVKNFNDHNLYVTGSILRDIRRGVAGVIGPYLEVLHKLVGFPLVTIPSAIARIPAGMVGLYYKIAINRAAQAKQPGAWTKAKASWQNLKKATTSGELKGTAVAQARRARILFRNAKNVGRILMYTGPQAIVGVVLDIAVFGILGSVAESFNTRLKARQCVKIFPLRTGPYPFTAGIRGHMGAVVGDDPSWADKLIFGFLTDEVDNGWFWNSIAWVGNLLGVEAPNYYLTEADIAVRRELEKMEKGEVVPIEGG